MLRSILLLIIVIPVLVSAQSLRSKVNKGNEHYSATEFEQALGNYKDALLDDPLNEKILFNEADALFKMEKFEEARQGYQKILATKDLNLAAKTHFNIGNTYFMENKLPESIESYKRSLDIDPEDFDAKYNLELARAKLKEQSEKQQQSPDQNQQQQQQNEQQSGDQEQENQDQQEKQQQDQQQQEQQAQEQQEQREQQQAQQSKDEINKEEAERILNALKEDEQEGQKKKAPVRAQGRRAEKDW